MTYALAGLSSSIFNIFGHPTLLLTRISLVYDIRTAQNPGSGHRGSAYLVPGYLSSRHLDSGYLSLWYLGSGHLGAKDLGSRY